MEKTQAIEEVDLPEINKVVLATCKRNNGEIEEHLIRRISTNYTQKGWQWSHPEIRTYFTLEVSSWKDRQ